MREIERKTRIVARNMPASPCHAVELIASYSIAGRARVFFITRNIYCAVLEGSSITHWRAKNSTAEGAEDGIKNNHGSKALQNLHRTVLKLTTTEISELTTLCCRVFAVTSSTAISLYSPRLI